MTDTREQMQMVQIVYCTSWGYLSKAARLAESILHDYYEQIPGGVTLVPGSGGIFEVSIADESLFSKEATGRFPNENEIEEKIEALLAA